MKLSLALLLLVAVVCCRADEMEDLSEKFTKIKAVLREAKLKMTKVEWKMKHNKLRDVVSRLKNYLKTC